ncbi:Small nuclear ribonucleoprotein G [Lachnellula occidentalis]|uniref:Small nuclear ribonucleoprotein G n=1 Tax=Lachnellula occidentalis TaxID=215460 RepID=A0A8H8RQ46_9HELO|nr:Small nuclear ribonucleoprotein G [Lachnellula occidentalis]
MPQAQPELKKVRKAPFQPYNRRQSRGNRSMRQQPSLEDRDGKSNKKDKWTDPRLQYLDKRLFVQLNGSRKVIGVLRGYDVFLNIVLDDAVEEKDGGEKVRLGMVVVRGNSVVMLEALERIGGGREDRG